MTYLIGAVAVVAAFGLVIFVHEFGHFIVAKWNGVKVERFSFGLGPEAFGFRWGETRYCVAWIPLGGEVRMAGEMEPGGAAPAERDPRDFFAKAWYRRLSIVVAGPTMNYILAFVLFTGVFWFFGNPRASTEPVIGEVLAGRPAEAAGLKAGDRILSVDGQSVATWIELATSIQAAPDKPLLLEVRRDEEVRSLTVTPRPDPERGHGLIGIGPHMTLGRLPFGSALRAGAQQTVFWTVHTVTYLADKIVRRKAPDLAGPIGIATVISKSAQSSLQDFLFLVALISLGIGLFNFFPIPLLDGGHMVFYLWEGIARRPVSARMVRVANVAGLSVLIGILVFATYSDIRRLVVRPGAAAPDSAPR